MKENYIYSIDDFSGKLTSWNVLKFHGKIHTPQEHYQVILSNPNTYEDLIFVSVATSQIGNQLRRLQYQWLPDDSLVIVEVWEVPFLSLRTCFNCNSLESYSIYDLYSYFSEWKIKFTGNLPWNILQKIYDAIKITPRISLITKKKIFGNDFREE